MSVNKVNSDGSLLRVAGGTLYADLAVGSIVPFGGSAIPSGYLLCDGQAVSRTTYAELFKVIGAAFGAGDGSTTFNVPDLREATTKGIGLSGKSNNHFDSDGVALGEFVEDRLQAHTHSHKIGSSTAGSEEWVMFATSQVLSGMNQTDYGVVGRFGNTTEVKAVGVNYIIKAKQVAVPFDMAEYVRNQNVLSGIETVTLPMTAPYDGELIAVASGGGYVTFSINGSQYTIGSLAGLTSTSGLPIKKGDVLTLESLVGTAGFTARYYKLRDYTGKIKV